MIYLKNELNVRSVFRIFELVIDKSFEAKWKIMNPHVKLNANQESNRISQSLNSGVESLVE